MNSPVPVVIAPLPVVCRLRVLAPMSQVLAAAPVRLRAPAEVTARVPEVVVLRVSGPEATVTLRPPVVGPVMVRALVPLKVWLPLRVVVPAPRVKASLAKAKLGSVTPLPSNVQVKSELAPKVVVPTSVVSNATVMVSPLWVTSMPVSVPCISKVSFWTMVLELAVSVLVLNSVPEISVEVRALLTKLVPLPRR